MTLLTRWWREMEPNRVRAFLETSAVVAEGKAEVDPLNIERLRRMHQANVKDGCLWNIPIGSQATQSHFGADTGLLLHLPLRRHSRQHGRVTRSRKNDHQRLSAERRSGEGAKGGPRS